MIAMTTSNSISVNPRRKVKLPLTRREVVFLLGQAMPAFYTRQPVVAIPESGDSTLPPNPVIRIDARTSINHNDTTPKLKPNMKREINSSLALRALLVACLLAAPNLIFNAMAAEVDNHWSPFVVMDDGNGPYAYFADPDNWDQAVAPTYTNALGAYMRVMDNQTVGSYVTCIITNDVNLYQLMIGAGGGGDVVITNGAQVTAGVGMYGGPNQWTGVGFPNGPSTLTIGPGCSFTCGDHLWVGQGTDNGTPNSVIINGGSLYVHGQLGVGWNGAGGTNYITLMNGGKAFLAQWASQTLGQPGNNSLGIMNLASNDCFVYITNNYVDSMNTLITNNQIIAYGGAGTILYGYDPVKNLTTLSAIPPTNAYTPIINAQPTNVVTSLGSTVAFHVGIANPPVNYQWLFNGNPLSDGGGISGAQTDTLTVSGVTPANIGNYTVTATSTVQMDQIATSRTVGLNSTGINLYPVITILGIPGDIYVTSYSTTVNGTYIPFATNTIGSFAPFYLVDTNTPMSVTRFYKTVQQ